MRLVIIPAILMPIFFYLGFRGNELGSLFVLFAAPTSTSSFVMAKSFGCDGELAGEIVLFTTLFASVSIFGWVYLLKTLALI